MNCGTENIMRLKFTYMAICLLSGTLLVSSVNNLCWAKKKDSTTKDKNAAASAEDPENKLVRLKSLEGAFLNCVNRRRSLTLSGLSLQRKLKETEKKDEKKKINEDLEKIQQRLGALNIAMNVVFSPVQPRQYEYNPVKSEVYLRVGNLEQVFVRSMGFRERLLKAIQEQQKKLEDKKNKKQKEKLEKGLESLKRQYQTMVASLQIVFDVAPERNYLYNPKDSTLYLKVTEEEAEKIQKKLDELTSRKENNE